jgi:cytochrome d ubiquinol oxidase subunit I
MEITALWLARAQFALSLNFHVLFVALAVFLGWLMFFLRLAQWRNPTPAALGAYRFWGRFFALSFFLAFASAVPVLGELGILWPPLMARIGNVAGPLLAFGITTLFVTKSVFMGVMLFGQRRVSEPAHLISVFMVALGLTATVFWGVALQSWTHAPEGIALIDGRFQVVDWGEIILNPGLGWYLALFASGGALTGGFLMIGISAWQACRRPLVDGERLSFRIGVGVVVAALVAQACTFDGIVRLQAQFAPAAAAAMVGYEATSHQLSGHGVDAPADPAAAAAAGAAADVPRPAAVPMARWLGHNAQGAVIGPADFAASRLPPVGTLYWLARIVITLWAVMAALALSCCAVMVVRGGDPIAQPRLLLRMLAGATLLGALSWLLCWNLVELGRSPFLVAGLLLQADVITESTPAALAVGLGATALVYAILLGGFFRMAYHAARYGVVPVRKAGVKA